ENPDILKAAPFDSIGRPQRIIRLFGGMEAYKEAIRELESEIYNEVA
ncbi:MAG: hypothetical protein LUI04_00075, partial [Porphyromonadaceae bacterium]|nr:hypothetical protein [Porphyromonadaceae bacterium]